MKDEHTPPRTDDPDPAQLAAWLERPEIRARIVAMLGQTEEDAVPSFWRRLAPIIVSASSALVMILAFFIPSVEDQWDRFRARQVIERHVDMGRHLVTEGHYRLAAAAFAKAFELSESRRLDIEEQRLEATVLQINEDPLWGVQNPDGLQEEDFLYLIDLQQQSAPPVKRAVTLNAYGAFLAAAHRYTDAEATLREAVSLDPRSHEAQVNLGNLLRDLDRSAEAEAAYRSAIALDENDPHAHYNLGVLLSETNRPIEAEDAFRRAVALDPTDADALRALIDLVELHGNGSEAKDLRQRLERLRPDGNAAKPVTEPAS